jgi:putative ABC transport system permease protein
MGTLLQDIRYGFRMMWKKPGFTLVAVLALALGIGANTTVFSIVDALLLRPFNVREPERLFMVYEQNLKAGFERGSLSASNFLDARAEVKSLEHLAAWDNVSLNMSEGDKAERLLGIEVSPEVFAAVDGRALLGRVLGAGDAEPGKEEVIVISHGLWQRRFGGDPSVVGREVNLNGRVHTVVGVMPRGFALPPQSGDVWKPLVFTPQQIERRGMHYLRMMGRLREGATPEQARAELDALAARLQAQYPNSNAGRSFTIETLITSYTRGPRPFLTVLLGAVGFVLLLACANVANLLLVRASSRHKEVAIRMALGASRWRLVRQMLTESVLLALIGGLLGLLIAVWGVDLMRAGIPANLARTMPNWENVGVNASAFYFALAVSVLTGLLFGLAPALQATRGGFNESLKDGGRTSGGGSSRNRLRSALVVSEVTLSLVLLIGAGLMIRSFVRLLETEPGFDQSNVMLADVELAGPRYDGEAPAQEQARGDFYRRLVERVGALPGVESAAVINIVPLSRSNTNSSYVVVGQPVPSKDQEPMANWRVVSPDYLALMKIPLLRGRHLDGRDDRADAPRAALVNEALARKHFAGGDPLGQRLNFGGDPEEKDFYQIVGVVGDIKHRSLDGVVEPEVYVPYAKSPWSGMTIAARTTGDPAQLFAAVEAEVGALDRDQPMFNPRTLEQVVAESLAPQRVTMGMLGVFAVIALLLAAIGIYAVMSYSVAQRTHEIGIRMALGAQPGNILKMIVGQGMLLAGVGIAIGLLAAFFLMQGMARILYGVSATDPATFVGISLALALVALAANFFPARRATKVDPMVALRYE